MFSTDEATPGGLTSSGLPGGRDLDALETAPQRVTPMVKGWKHLSYDKKLKEQNCSTWREGSWRAFSEGSEEIPLQQFHKNSRGGCKQDRARLFLGVPSDGTRDNGQTLQDKRFLLSTRKSCFTVRVTKHWHRLPRETDCGVSILGKIEKLSGHSIGQPALGAFVYWFYVAWFW